LQAGDPDPIRRVATILALHGRYSHAHRLIELAAERGIVGREVVQVVEGALVAWHKRAYVRRIALDVAEKLVQKVGERLAPLR
jgi:hypothetical protein